MLRKLSAALLFGSLLAFVPASAEAAPAPAGSYEAFHHKDDNHYRCWYHCDRRHRPYDRHKHRGYCWYHDRYGWYYSRCHGGGGHGK